MNLPQVVSFEPARESRKARRVRIKLEKEALAVAESIVDEDVVDVDNVLETFTGGPWGALVKAGFWGPPRLKLPKHRVSSRRLGAANMFLAEAGLGMDGAFIGLDLESGGVFCLDPWELVRKRHITGPSMLTIGIQGSGKSSTNKALATRLIALGRKIAIISDPKGEWVRIARALGGTVIKIGPSCEARLNPLDPGERPAGMGDKEWAGLVEVRRRKIVVTVISLLRHGTPLGEYEHTALDLTLGEVLKEHEVPTLVDVMERLLNPSEATLAVFNGANPGEAMAHVLRRLTLGDLQGMFDGHSTETVDANTPMIVIDTSDLLGASDEAVAIASACCSAWIDSIARSGGDDFWLIVQEEGWSAMRDPKVVESMDERQRLAGEYGIANMLIMHELKDLNMVGPVDSPHRNQAEGLMSKSQVKIIHRQARESADQVAEILGLTAREKELVVTLDQGNALWKIGNKSFLVQTVLTPNEYELFHTDTRREG